MILNVEFWISDWGRDCSHQGREGRKRVIGIQRLRPRSCGIPHARGNWPPRTCPRPFSNVAPRRDRCPLTRGNSKGWRVEDCGGPGGELNLEYEMGSFRAAFLVAGG